MSFGGSQAHNSIVWTTISSAKYWKCIVTSGNGGGIHGWLLSFQQEYTDGIREFDIEPMKLLTGRAYVLLRMEYAPEVSSHGKRN
jgi:hypothetical protein